MYKEAYPDKYLFSSPYHNMSNVYRAFMLEVGNEQTTISRTVPSIINSLSNAGGLFESFGYMIFIINVLLISPIDMLEFFFAV